MADTLTQPELTQLIKDYLKSFNAKIDTKSTGTYYDVMANASAGSLKSVVDWVAEQVEGTVPSQASSTLLEKWLLDTGQVPRKTGTFAKGLVSIVLETEPAPNNPVVVPIGTTFSINNILNYVTTVEYSLATKESTIEVQAEKTGAEFNVASQVAMITSFPVESVTGLGFFGGSGSETRQEMLKRVITWIAFRKTDGQLTDYLQRALELYNEADVSTLFVDNIVPYGVLIVLNRTIDDFDLAVDNPNINEISLSSDELIQAKAQLVNYGTVTGTVQIETINTQVITNLVCYVKTSTGTLTNAQETETRKAVRKALLQYKGDKFTRISLSTATLPDYVIDFRFNSFDPVTVTSNLLDSISIGVLLDEDN